MTIQPQYIASIIQVILACIYFPVYYFAGVKFAIVFAGIFTVWDMNAWGEAFRLHSKESSILPLLCTIFSSGAAVIFFFANLYEILGSIKNQEDVVTGLWNHVYFSIITFTTLGYGDYLPFGYAKIAAAFEAILGYFYFAFIIGVSGSIYFAKLSKT